jgi:CRISPR-associated protein Csx1
MGDGGIRILLVASWGNPSEWRPARYRLPLQSVFHEGLRRSLEAKLQGVEVCLSNCSTLALASLLKRASVEVEMLVFGLDTLVQPASSGDLRKRAEEVYRGFAEKFIRECSCCSILERGEEPPVRVVVTPGMGMFHGYAYKGSPVHIFNVAFSRILESVERFEPTFIVVDITHGVNYQMTAILYATMAAAALTGMDSRVAIFNSEPYPRRRRESPPQQPHLQQPPQGEPAEEPPLLNILDVAQLSEALRFAHAVSDALYFRSARLSRLLASAKPREPSMEEGCWERGSLRETLQRLVRFVKLFENAAVGLTFPGAFGERREKLPYSICDVLEGLPQDQKIEYQPEVQGNTVSYQPARIEESLTLALAKVLRKLAYGGRLAGRELSGLCAEEARQSLVEYMSAAAEWLGFAGLKYAELIVKREQQKLAAFARNVAKCREEIESDEELKRYLHCDEASIEVNAPLVMALAEQRVEERSCKDVVEKVREALKLQAQLSRESARLSEKDARDVSAHAGLSYRIIRSVILTELKGELVINKVVFDKEKVEQYLEIIGAREDRCEKSTTRAR